MVTHYPRMVKHHSQQIVKIGQSYHRKYDKTLQSQDGHTISSRLSKTKNPGWSNTIPSRLSKLDSHTIESMIKHCNPRMVTQSPVGCQKQKTQDGQTPFPVDCQKIIGQSYHRKCGNPHDYRMVTIILSKLAHTTCRLDKPSTFPGW